MSTVDQGYEIAKRVRSAKRWMVRSGDNVVGPVSIELIERGLEAGKIPGDAEMAHEGGGAWRRVADVFGTPQPRGAAYQPEPMFPTFPDEPVSIPKQGMVAALFG